jgi:hypothetical protein
MKEQIEKTLHEKKNKWMINWMKNEQRIKELKNEKELIKEFKINQ